MGFENFDLVKILRVCGGLSGVVVTILGIWQLVTSVFNPKTTINGCYQVLFGLLAITAELRLEQVLTHFKFLTHFLGLGLFYIFVGGLALGGEWYNIAVAVILLAVGILYTSLGLCCRKFGHETFGEAKVPSDPSRGEREEGQPINSAPPSDSSYQPPLNNRPISSSNSDLQPGSRSPWDPSGVAAEKRGSYSAVPSNEGAGTGGGGKRESLSNKGAWGGDGWSAAHSEGDVNFPRALVGVAIANPQQTVAVASAVSNNPIARAAVQGDSAGAGGKEDQMKKSSMEYAIRQSNPFAEQ